MNWITTNITLPEEVYEALKKKAAKEQKSVDAIIHDKLLEKKSRLSKKEQYELLQKLDKVSSSITAKNKGANFTQGIIDMRYEQ